MVLLDRSFLKFVEDADGLLRELRAAGQLRSDLPLDGVRSALMGVLEGLMRDQLLARRMAYPACYNSQEIRSIFQAALASFAAPAVVRAS